MAWAKQTAPSARGFRFMVWVSAIRIDSGVGKTGPAVQYRFPASAGFAAQNCVCAGMEKKKYCRMPVFWL